MYTFRGKSFIVIEETNLFLLGYVEGETADDAVWIPREKVTDAVITTTPAAAKTIYTDTVTGEQMPVSQFFFDNLPNVLQRGESNALSVRACLQKLGRDYTNDTAGIQFQYDSRQLRDAKERLVAQRVVAIVAVRSKVGGYYIPENPQELLDNAAVCRAQADGCIRNALALEALASAMHSQVAL